MSFQPTSLSLLDLDARARAVFKDIVESYLETGEPVGSRTLAQRGGSEPGLSAASIRNTMADLAALGLLSSAHISAGRMPTHQGLRLFVDGLLEIGDLSKGERKSIDAQLAGRDMRLETVLEKASQSLAGLAGGAGLVLAPAQSDVKAGYLRHVEFVGLDAGQALAVLVYADGHVENRIMDVPAGLVPAALERAGNFLSARLKGKRLSQTRDDILVEIETGKAALEASAAGLVKQGIAEWSGSLGKSGEKIAQKRSLIVRGRARLLDNPGAQSDLERIRLIFEDLERKEELIALLDEAQRAKGVRIFIGAENPLFSLSGSSVVVAPYKDSEQNIIGALGVIGPTRLNYARVIPMVDYTASVIGRLLQMDR
ncbi:MAG: heat-inducible transcriptional repressor HrcA [Robiginitomaculum sp.]|nr:MAG: heat-inducible transcriptional repressor HrcA [Robiginitomaculum sp.]